MNFPWPFAALHGPFPQWFASPENRPLWVRVVQAAQRRFSLRTMTLDHVLTGGFTEWRHYALKDSPHVKFLEQFKDAPEIDPDRFKSTQYFHHGCEDIRNFGSFFGLTEPDRIIEQATYFLSLYRAMKDGTPLAAPPPNSDNEFHSSETYPLVAQVAGSDYYVIKDGHHRIAASYVLRWRTVKARVVGTAKITLEEVSAMGILPKTGRV